MIKLPLLLWIDDGGLDAELLGVEAKELDQRKEDLHTIQIIALLEEGEHQNEEHIGVDASVEGKVQLASLDENLEEQHDRTDVGVRLKDRKCVVRAADTLVKILTALGFDRQIYLKERDLALELRHYNAIMRTVDMVRYREVDAQLDYRYGAVDQLAVVDPLLLLKSFVNEFQHQKIDIVFTFQQQYHIDITFFSRQS